jgi:hypothetical protein
LLSLSTFDKLLCNRVKVGGQTDDAMRAIILVKPGYGIAAKSPVVNDNHIFGDLLDQRPGHPTFCLLPGMDLHVHDQFVEYIIGA